MVDKISNKATKTPAERKEGEIQEADVHKNDSNEG
jgi:hypothetical protein